MESVATIRIVGRNGNLSNRKVVIRDYIDADGKQYSLAYPVKGDTVYRIKYRGADGNVWASPKYL